MYVHVHAHIRFIVCTYVRYSDKAFESIAKEYGASSPKEINLIKTEVSADARTPARTLIDYFPSFSITCYLLI
jgi:hypothetical protein